MSGLEIGGMVVGSVSLGAQIPHMFRVLPDYLDRFRNARKDVDGVQRELVSLHLCVRDLERDFKNYDDETKTNVLRAMQSCEVTVNEMEKFLQKFGAGSFRSRLRWSSTDKDTIGRFRNDLERHKQHLNITLSKASLKTIFDARNTLLANVDQTNGISTAIGQVQHNSTAVRDELRNVHADLCAQILALRRENQTMFIEQVRQVENLVEGLKAQATPQERAELFYDEGVDLSPQTTSQSPLSKNETIPGVAEVEKLSYAFGGESSISAALLGATYDDPDTTREYTDRIAQLEQELTRAKTEAKSQADRVILQKHFLDQRNAERDELLKRIQQLEQSLSQPSAQMPLSPPSSPETSSKYQSIMSARIESPRDLRYTDIETPVEPSVGWTPWKSNVAQTGDARRTASNPIAHDVPEVLRKTASLPTSTIAMPIPLIEFQLWDEQRDNPKIESPGDVYTIRPKAWMITDVGPWSKGNLFLSEKDVDAYMSRITRDEQTSRKLFANCAPFINIKRYLDNLLRTQNHPEQIFVGKSSFLQAGSRRLEDGSTIYGEKLKHGDSIWLVLRDSKTFPKDLVLDDLTPSTWKYLVS